MPRRLPPSLDELLKGTSPNTTKTVRFRPRTQRNKQARTAPVNDGLTPHKRKVQTYEEVAPEEQLQPIVQIKDTTRDLLELPSRKKHKLDVSADLHWSQKPLAQMTKRDWRIMREDFDISAKGAPMENPLRTWDEAQDLAPGILQQIRRRGFSAPTPVQRATIPTGLKNRDVIGIAETGSGKTLAYMIPALNYVQKLPTLDGNEGPYVLILVPARELALQVESEFRKFCAGMRISAVSLIGGHSYEENVDNLASGAEVVIATPGRLIDCLEMDLLTLDRCFFLVLDEADRMVDMGFEEQVQKILHRLPPGERNPFGVGHGRTTMMFTATMPEAIEKIARDSLDNPTIVTVGEVGEAVERVKQIAIQAPPDDEHRLPVLRSVLQKQHARPPIIVFANYKKTCEAVGEELQSMGYRCVVMHGSKAQQQREESIRRLKNGQADILVATDVAGRGIDIPNVSLVVNYQMTRNIEEYTHRIGRTGRAGKSGRAITFWDSETDQEVLADLRQALLKSPSSECPRDLDRNEHARGISEDAIVN